jgi:hypothetical protein
MHEIAVAPDLARRSTIASSWPSSRWARSAGHELYVQRAGRVIDGLGQLGSERNGTNSIIRVRVWPA